MSIILEFVRLTAIFIFLLLAIEIPTQILKSLEKSKANLAESAND